MKTIYVNTDTFEVSMAQRDDYAPFETDLFNYFSDKDIEAQFYVPKGYIYIDPISGETYTGEYVCTKTGMPTVKNIAEIRDKAQAAKESAEQAISTASAARESTVQSSATLDDVMAALVELADMVATLSEEPLTAVEEA